MYTYDEALNRSTDYFNGDELAGRVFVDKYALRDGGGNILEDTPDKMHRRLANEFARVEVGKFKKPLSEEEIFNLFDKFQYIIPQGSIMFGAGNDYSITSLSNCYTIESPIDSYGGIMKIDEQLVQISKRRGGVGLDLSKLRPKGSPTKNSSRTSTGVVAFAERYSNSIREVGQDGRRGALMLTLSCHHPDILDFVNMKADLTKVTGANVSVRLSDEFLKAVENKTTYELRFPVDAAKPIISKLVDANEVWNQIIHMAWKTAEPGLLFWDRMTKYNVVDCYEDYKSISCNPCCHASSQDVFVKTNSGLKEIKQVTANDLVWVTDAFVDKWAATSGYLEAGVADVYKVDFSNGQTFYITANHKLIVMGGYCEILDFKQLKDMRAGDEVMADDGDIYKIEAINYYSNEEVGCINVPGYGFFSTQSILSGNSEINLCANDSCRLMVLNLFSYVDDPFTANSSFNHKKLEDHAIIAQRLMDDMVDLELEKIDQIISKIKNDPEDDHTKLEELLLWKKIREKCYKGRRTGLGITGEGDMLAALGIKYDCEEAIELVGEVHKLIKLAAFRSSSDMAEELGSFPVWDWQLENDSEFLLQIQKEDPALYERFAKVGRRNIGILTCAPTGSVSILTQTTSGIEPLFMLKPYTRRKKINPSDKNARVDFVDPKGDCWQEFLVYHPKVKMWMDITNKSDLTESPWHGCTANDINWVNRVRLQASIQMHTDHSISSTINLPENVTEEEVSKIYREAWKQGLKGVTVYRNNCRTGVLVEKKTEATPVNFLKRPKELPTDIYHVVVRGVPQTVLVSLVEEKPYEVLVIPQKIKQSISKGKVVKHKKGCYDLVDEKGILVFEDIAGACEDEQANLTRFISMSLRHNIPIDYIFDQLSKSTGDINGFAKSISRCLKRYIPNNTKTNEKCPKCDNELRFSEGCRSCTCGYSKC